VFALQNSLLEAAGADDLLNGFLASSALCRNERAAALWNLRSETTSNTCMEHLGALGRRFRRRNYTKTWNDLSP
jgi:hypothetical protein